MRHILFGSSDSLSIAVLIKDSALVSTELYKHYISPLISNIPLNSLCAFSLKYEPSGKVSASVAKAYLTDSLLPALDSKGITTLLVPDATYFKYLTGVTKTDPHFGYILPCKLKGYEHISCILSINYGAMFYNPSLQEKLDISLSTLRSHILGTHSDPGKDIILEAFYPKSFVEPDKEYLLKQPALTCDIETTGLRFDRDSIYSIAFAIDKHRGIAFLVDSSNTALLKEFFILYTGKLIFHNALFDVKFLIYHLFMDHSSDFIGMRHGLEVFQHVDDTMIYSYLAQNSTADIRLGLKANSHEYTGNYALDDESIHDVTSIPVDDLLRYNLTDCLATWYVHDKYLPRLIADDQLSVYQTIFQPSIKPLLEMMLIGLPLDLNKTHLARLKLEATRDHSHSTLLRQPTMKHLNFELRIRAMLDANSKLKKKIKSLDEFHHIHFNPASPLQMSVLLYEIMKLPVIDLTKTKQPATGQKTLTKLIAHTQNPEYICILESLIALAQTSKILNDFITNFQSLHFRRNDGTTWLNGDQVLGGTQSGRLSARNPNLANLPSNSLYGKTIKTCFVAPSGWLFGGADFNALEDRIGAILSKDRMKTSEFSLGMDGHSLRAIAFFSQLEEPITIKGTYIDPAVVKQYDLTSVSSVNQFKKDHPKIRQEAKAPSFALAYGGTWITLHKNLGIPEPVAKAMEAGYKELYKDTMTFNHENAVFASTHGYMECAFGLRIRTPLLAQCILGSRSTPYEVDSEARSANNAKSQSWGMLSNRASIEIQERIISSPYAQDIFLANQIHDAIYFIWRDDPHVTHWLNTNLIECMEWQDDPAIASTDIPLGAELDFGISWSKQKTISNKASLYEIISVRDSLRTYTHWSTS